MRIGFTHHAVDRYIQHHAREMPRAEARALLEEHARDAVKLKEKSILGDTQWRIEALGIICVTKPDDGEHVCVTILPNRDLRGWMTSEEREILEERISRFHAEKDGLQAQKESAASLANRLEAAPRGSIQDKQRRVDEARKEASDHAKKLAFLEWEYRIVSAGLKTVRHGITNKQNTSAHKEALRIAVRYISSLYCGNAAEDPETVLLRIAQVNPGLVSPAFYAAERDEQGHGK